MSDRPVDLRSDTVTKPTPAMREAMLAAEVGDDVLGDDPTVNALQEKVAALLGKEAALFVPSGTMGNQIAIRAQTQPGDEIIAHRDSHIYYYEGGAPSALSGCSVWLVEGEGGLFTGDDVRTGIRPVESHFAQTRMVVIENTHNRGGGTVWPLARVRDVQEAAREHGLRMHLDGARLCNAAVASGTPLAQWGACFDTVSICFSKGLGAPVGSALAGDRATIKRAHRFRKMFGGGMRQAGILAAAAIHALDHHVERLDEDHRHAKRIAESLAAMPGATIDARGVATNIVFFGVKPEAGTAADVAERLAASGVLVLPLGPQRLRAVTHLDVNSEQVDRAIEAFRSVLG